MADPLDRLKNIAEQAQKIDALADVARTVVGLRKRANAARIKATKKGPIGRAFWTWRYNVLSERADKLARERGLTILPR